MSTFSLPLHRLSAALALAAILVGFTSARAAKPSKTPKDSAPVLMSRTGGGSMWADVKELEQAALKGNPKAQAQFGEMLVRGDGVPQDAARGTALLEQAARAGNSSAMFRIGMLLANGESGVAKDPARALDYFRAAAAGGEKEAFFNIGAAYANGLGVKRDYGEALGWLIVARQRGADASAETALRTRITYQPWIAKGERRAKEIEQEFAGKKPLDLLPPPAPLDAVAEPPKKPKPADPLRPTAESKKDDSLRPNTANDSLKPSLKPSLPSLPPPKFEP